LILKSFLTEIALQRNNYIYDKIVESVYDYMDEFRISKGIARWTSNFSVPTKSYSAVDSVTDFTVDLWVSPIDSPASDAYIIGVDDSWKITLDGTSNKYLKFTAVGSGALIAPVSLIENEWNHIAVVQHNGLLSIYLNGVLAAANTGFVTANTATPLTIGASEGSESGFYGYIEEVRISKGIARWTSDFNVPSSPYSLDSYTKLLLPLNVVTLPAMTLVSNAFPANSQPTSARIVIFEEDIDVVNTNVDLQAYISRDGGTTFTQVLLAKQNMGENIFTGTVDISSQPSGTLMVYKLVTANNKDLRLYSVALSWK